MAAIRKGAIRVMRGELRGFSGPGSVLVAPPAAAAAGAGMQQGPEAAAAADEEGAAFGEPQPHAFDAVVLCTGGLAWRGVAWHSLCVTPDCMDGPCLTNTETRERVTGTQGSPEIVSFATGPFHRL